MPDRDGTRQDCVPPVRPLPEEYACAVLLAGMVGLMFAHALVRNVGPLGRTQFATWLAHGIEVLPSGLTWLTFLGVSAVTRRGGLLRIDVLLRRLPDKVRGRLERGVLLGWGVFFAALFCLGVWATWQQRGQMTSIRWLPAWAVSLSIPVGAVLVVVRTVQRGREMRGRSKAGEEEAGGGAEA